jgi:hypothetical protein
VVELIVETTPWAPRARNARRELTDMVLVRIDYSEIKLRERVKAAGAIWRHKYKLWELDWKIAREFGLQERVVEETLD